jgi:hypothetical protein
MRLDFFKVFFLLVALLVSVQTTTVTTNYFSQKGTITYSVTDSSDSTTYDTKRYVITPTSPTASRIRLIFSAFSMYSAEVHVEEEVNGKTVTLFTCASCGSGYTNPPIPPYFDSTTGSLTVRAYGSSGVSFSSSGFTLQYVSILASADSSMSTVSLAVSAGYDHIIPIPLNDGTIQAGAVQTWDIDTTDGASSASVTITMSDMNMNSDCLTTLNIYDDDSSNGARTTLFSGCQSSNQPEAFLYSTTGKVSIVLDNSGRSTDDVIHFDIIYRADKDLFNCGSLLDYDTLTAQTGFIIDGSISTENMRKGQDCQWLIAPSNGASITLLFHRVSLKYGSSVKVYDASNTTGVLLWDSGQIGYDGGYDGATITAPAPIISTYKTLYIVYTSSSLYGAGSLGFYAEYYTNTPYSKGIGNVDGESLVMSTALSIGIPGNGIRFPISYTYNWNIRPDNVISGGVITFAMDRLYLPTSGDELTLYDGTTTSDPVIATFTGNAGPPATWYRTTGTDALLQFTSGAGTNTVGYFSISYFVDGPNYHCGYQTNPITLNAHSFTFTDGSSSVESLYKDQNCQWIIDPSDTVGITVFFTRYQMIGATLEIYNYEGGSFSSDNLLFTIAETPFVPSSFYLEYSKIGIIYSSDGSGVSGLGFSATYYRSSDNRDDESEPGDNLVRIHSSSMLSLTNDAPHGYIRPTRNTTYLIQPSNATGSIYIFISQWNLTGCHASVSLYDGLSIHSPLIGAFCGNDIPYPNTWLYTTSNALTINFANDNGRTNYYGNFDISYYSDGGNSHCGFPYNPGRVTAPSMVITDGSSTTGNMYYNQHCEWIVSPTMVSGGTVVVEMLENNMTGGLLEIYDGNNNAGKLIWRCLSCTQMPRPLLARSGEVFIKYVVGSMETVTEIGEGFRLVYWTMNNTRDNLLLGNDDSEVLLEHLPTISLPADYNNKTEHWYMYVDTTEHTLSYQPRILTSVKSTGLIVQSNVNDGRNKSIVTDYQTHESTIADMCGIAQGSNKPVLTSPLAESKMMATQWPSSFVDSRRNGKTIYTYTPSGDTTNGNGIDSVLAPAGTCKYIIDSGSTQSVILTITSWVPGNARLTIYAGIYGNDHMYFDSDIESFEDRADGQVFYLACGRGTILVENNNGADITHSFAYTYLAREGDEDGAICNAYILSLIPVEPWVDPWIPYYIALISCFSCCILTLLCLYLRKLSKKYAPENGWNPLKGIKIYKIVTPRHLRYTPKWDAFRNKFLPTGTCSICQDKCPVFRILPCNHALCAEDLCGYLGNALGDISQFPVKCPLHYEGCTSTIGAKIAKRVLDVKEYEKFNEFSDRVTYGEGMRCIFCNNYVNFPEEGGFSMVECPYCVQTFCIRCRRPWHFDSKCPLDNVDDSLDTWKKISGAQKCPACAKLIEKSDRDTCNHMIHKITDGIPCVKDRTDFCYCCGEEVLGDYPHEEVKRPGVNHFPDGVYQQCIVITKKQRDAERDRLKKIRRMRNNKGGKKRQQAFDGFGDDNDSPDKGEVEYDSDGWEKIPDTLMYGDAGGGRVLNNMSNIGDHFDKAFEMEGASELDASLNDRKEADSPANSYGSPSNSPVKSKPKKKLTSVPSRLPALNNTPTRLPPNSSAANRNTVRPKGPPQMTTPNQRAATNRMKHSRISPIV